MSRSVDFKACLAILALLLSSCIREDMSHCPSPPEVQHMIVVAVADKNYENAAEVGHPVVENLPLATWLSSLVVWRRPEGTTSPSASAETIDPAELTHPLDAASFPAGTNDITAIGNDPSGVNAVPPPGAIALHPEGSEGSDIYIGADAVRFPLDADKTIPMYRTKGKLIVDTSLLPASATAVEIVVGNIYGAVQRTDRPGGTPADMLLYSGSTAVSKKFALAPSGSRSLETILAPSISGAASSPVTITFTDAEGTHTIPVFNVAILRNRITVVRPEWNPVKREWTITVMVNGAWHKVHYLSISD